MMQIFENKVTHSDSLVFTKQLPDKSIDSVITSPPYYQLRNYGFDEQWGLEKTYQEYLNNLISLMVELKRVLKDEGTMWINLGDTYMNNSSYSDKGRQGFGKDKVGMLYKHDDCIQQKSLMLIPHRFAIRCVDELGLILRNDIIWGKRNGMPESVSDRFGKKHEFIFFFVKQQKYYFDLDRIRDKTITGLDRCDVIKLKTSSQTTALNSGRAQELDEKGSFEFKNNPLGKNPGDVSDFWDIPTKPSSAKHYATYNNDLINKPIIAGCPEGGIIFDPFAGTGTTLVRAIQLGRKTIGCDGNREYCEIANKNIQQELAQLKLAI